MFNLLNYINRLQFYKHYKYEGYIKFNDGVEYKANIITHGRNKKEAIQNLKKDNPYIRDGKFYKKFLKEINYQV